MKAAILVVVLGVSVIVSACGQNPLAPARVASSSSVSPSLAPELGSGFTAAVLDPGPCGLVPCAPTPAEAGPCGSVDCTPPVDTPIEVPTTHQHPSPTAPPATEDPCGLVACAPPVVNGHP